MADIIIYRWVKVNINIDIEMENNSKFLCWMSLYNIIKLGLKVILKN